MDEEEKKVFRWKPYIITSIINLIIAAFIVVLVFIILKKPLLDGFTFAFIGLALLATMMWLGREGVFDIFAYGFRQFGSIHFTKNPTQFNDFPGYKQDKMTKRSKRAKLYLATYIASAVFLIATLIIYFVTKA